ncbi:hypothetical protein [Streptomyces sp. DH37]|nr:hypothetical protein [Streptomyces sp. DH37]MDG9703836.1 hypothetical protein [Streptomyces sp. DH37]
MTPAPQDSTELEAMRRRYFGPRVFIGETDRPPHQAPGAPTAREEQQR